MTLHSRFSTPSHGHAPLTPDALFPATAARPLSLFQAGSEIYAPGDRAAALYQVGFGCVRIYRLLADGRRQISAFHLAGETFGFEADGTHHFFADAVAPAGIRVLKLADASLASHHILPLALEGLARAQNHLLVLGRQSAVERVAAFLLDLAARQGDLDHVELAMSRTDIADYLGLTIETVSRVLSKLKQQRIIRLPNLRTVEIVDAETLRDMSE